MHTRLKTLFLATRNGHKKREVQQILGANVLLLDETEFPQLPEIQEIGTTFEANARLKAEGISRHISTWVLADDSGLEVDALDGEPGIYSARYAGAQRSDLENTNLVLKRMENIPWIERSARFWCFLALAREGKSVAVFEGCIEGMISREIEGEGGFGYDPIFIPQGYEKTFGTLSQKTKNEISHRACALRKFALWWQQFTEESCTKES